jgi:hypothetical protein
VEAKTVQTGAIRTLKEALKCILVEMSLLFDKDGIRMVAMDNSKQFWFIFDSTLTSLKSIHTSTQHLSSLLA